MESVWQGVSLVSFLLEFFLPLLPRLLLLTLVGSLVQAFAFIFLFARSFHVLTWCHPSAESALGHRVLSFIAQSWAHFFFTSAAGHCTWYLALDTSFLGVRSLALSLAFSSSLFFQVHFISLSVVNLLSLGSYHEGSFACAVWQCILSLFMFYRFIQWVVYGRTIVVMQSFCLLCPPS